MTIKLIKFNLRRNFKDIYAILIVFVKTNNHLLFNVI